METLNPAFKFQSPAAAADDSTWLSSFKIDANWGDLRGNTKYIISKVLAFVSLSPMLFNAKPDQTIWDTLKAITLDFRNRTTLESVVDAFFDCLESVLIFSGAGTFAGAFSYSMRTAEELYTSLHREVTEYCNDGNGDVIAITDRIYTARKFYNDLRTKCKSSIEQKHITDRLTAIDLHLTRVNAIRNSQGIGYAARGIGFSGPAGIGKSLALEPTVERIFQEIGVEKRKGVYDEKEKFQSNISSATTYVVCDDVGKEKEKYTESPIGSWIINAGSNEQTLIHRAEVDSKGVMYLHALIIGLTGNLLGLNLHRGLTHPAAVSRRVWEFWVDVDKRRAVQNADGTWRPKESQILPEPTHLTFQLVRNKATGEDYNPVKVGKVMSWEQFQEYITGLFLEHHKEQLEIMQRKSVSRERCPCGRYKVNCSKCLAVDKSLQAGRTFGDAIVDKLDTKLWDSLSAWFPLCGKDEVQLKRLFLWSFMWTLVASSSIVVNMLLLGNAVPLFFSGCLLMYHFTRMLAVSIEKERLQFTHHTVEAVRETMVSRPSLFTTGATLCGVSIGALLYAIHNSRRFVYQDPSVQDGDSEEEDLNARVFNERTNDKDHPRVKELAQLVKTNRMGEPITVSETKALIRHEGLVSQLVENYWNVPNRTYPSSQSGSGSTDTDVIELFRQQTFYIVEKSGRRRYRMALQVEPGLVLINKHFLPDLVHNEYYKAVRNETNQSQEIKFRFDKASVIESADQDIAVFPTKYLFGKVRSLLKYFSEDFRQSSDLTGYQVVPEKAVDKSFSTMNVRVSVKPNSCSPIEGDVHRSIFDTKADRIFEDGFCGGAVIVNKCCIGIHSWGSSIPSTTGGGGCLIRRSTLEKMMRLAGPHPGSDEGPLIDLKSAEVRLTAPHPKNPSNWVGTGLVTVACHVPRDFSHRSNLEPNPYAPEFEKLFDAEIIGKMAPATGSVNKVAHAMLSMANAFRGEALISEMDRACDHYLEGIEKVIDQVVKEKEFPTRPLGVTAALFGLEGHPYEKGVNPKKSAGALFKCAKERFIADKDDDTKTGYLQSDFEHDLLECVCRLKQNQRTGCVGRMLGKDEPLPYKNFEYLSEMFKGLKDKRGFIGCNMLFQVLIKMYLGPAMDIMQEACHWFGNVVGIDPGGTEWSVFVDNLLDGRDPTTAKFLSMDFSAFDVTHCNGTTRQLARMFVRINRHLGWSDEDLAITEILATEMTSMWIEFGGPIILGVGIWPSGIPPTAIGGAFMTVMVIVAAFLRHHPDKKFREYIRIYALGDDNIMTVRKEHQDFEFEVDKITDFAREIGMELTADVKEGEIAWTTIDDTMFLSRRNWFHPELKRFVGRLKLQSLYRPLAIWQKNSKHVDQLNDLATSSVREAALHGREFFNKHTIAWRKFFRSHNWAVPIAVDADYDTYIEVMQYRDSLNTPRKKYQMPNLAEASPEAEDEQEIREIAEPGPVESNPVVEAQELSTMRVQLPTRTLPPYVEREIRITSLDLPNDVHFQFDFNPLEELMASQFISERLSTYHAINFHIKVRFAVSGTKFHYGKFIAYAVYRPSELDFQQELSYSRDLRIPLVSQRNGIYFTVGDGETVAELSIPFFHQHAYLRLNSADVSDYVSVRVETVTPPRCAVDDVPTNASIVAYARFEEVRAIGHTPRAYQGPKTVDEGRPKPSAIIGRAARLADAASRIPGVSLPANIASGVLHGAADLARACGYSRPIDYGAAPYVPFSTPSTASANTDIAGRVLAYDINQSVAVEHNLVHHGGIEELNIKNLVSKQTIIATGTIPQSVADLSTPWLSINVTPAIELFSGNLSLFTPQGLVSSMRKYWHGTMCYRLELMTTAMTGGKILVSYNADGSEPNPAVEVLDNYAMDLKASHSMVIRVNWMSPDNFLVTFGDIDRSIFSNYDPTRHNGCLHFSTIQRIVGTKADQPIDFVVTAWMENEVFFNPDYCHLTKRAIDGERLVGSSVLEVDENRDDYRLDYRTLPTTLGPSTSFPVTNAPTPAIGQESSSQPTPLGGSGPGFPATNAPNTSAPSPALVPDASTMPSFMQTFFPTRNPTGSPSLRPSQNTEEPSAQPSAFPTGPIVCTTILKEVPFEWLGARSRIVPSGKGIIKAGAAGFRVPYWPRSSGSVVEIIGTWTGQEGIINDVPANLVSYVKDLQTNIATISLSSSSAPGSVANGLWSMEFLSDFTIDRVMVSLPLDLVVREVRPADMTTFFGQSGNLETRTVDGVTLDAWVPGAERTLDNYSTVPNACGADLNFGFASFNGTRTLPSVINALPGYFTDPVDGSITFGSNLALFGWFYLDVERVFQGADVSDTVTFEVGEHLGTHSALIGIHAGEDIVSLRQDLKVFRPAFDFVTTSGVDYTVQLHNVVDTTMSPFRILQYCFAAQRGGMTAWYRMTGDGYYMAQRFPTCAQDPQRAFFLRGYEYADSRVNPSLMVAYPWYGRLRFDLARGSFDASDDNFRSVVARPHNPGDTIVLREDLAISEDFSFLLFMGCPVLLR
jgi:hypothetical protein